MINMRSTSTPVDDVSTSCTRIRSSGRCLLQCSLKTRLERVPLLAAHKNDVELEAGEGEGEAGDEVQPNYLSFNTV